MLTLNIALAILIGGCAGFVAFIVYFIVTERDEA